MARRPGSPSRWPGLLIALLVPALAGAQQPDGAATKAPDAVRTTDSRRTLGRLPHNLLRGTTGLVAADNVLPALAGGGVVGVALLLDDSVADYLSAPERRFGLWLEHGGQPWISSAATFGLLVGSRFSDSPRFRAVSYDLFNAQIVDWAYTTVLKRTVRRARPDGSDVRSFPSGHASNAFALATVIEGHFGWRGGLPAYAVAGAVAASRLQRNKHYLSDVVGGATVGYLVGRTIVRTNSTPVPGAGSTVAVTPAIGLRTRAVFVSIGF